MRWAARPLPEALTLTMMCDIRYASEPGQIRTSREIVLSLNPTIDPLWRIVGLSNAMESALTGRIWDAQDALRMGYISRIFPEKELLKEVASIAREMATYNRGCLKETKQLTHLLMNSSLDQAMRQQEWLFRSYIGSEDNHRRIDDLQTKLASMRRNK